MAEAAQEQFGTSKVTPRISLLAAAMMHAEGAYSVISLPHRNNNPGNLRHWGSVPVVNGYCKFPKMIEGYTALLEDIWVNRAMKIKDFLVKFAPPTENATSSYISIVCGITTFGPDELIDVS